jgi:hypothetical protein
MNRACELTEGKILLNIDLADESSPARIVDSMWEAGNKKSSCLERKYKILITYYLTQTFPYEIMG